MSPKHSRRHRSSRRATAALMEAVERRVLFAYLSLTPQSGGANPFNGVSIPSGGAAPVLADINADGDLDLIIGANDGALRQYDNTGSATNPTYSLIAGTIDIGDASAPALGDLDGDGDLDMIVGEFNGTLKYFKNTAGATNGILTEQSGAANPLNGADVGQYSQPTLGDLDHDGDLDCLVGALDGTLSYFKNTGTAASPVMTLQAGAANPLNGVSTGSFATSSLADVDRDGDLDALVGKNDGALLYFKNTGTPTAPVFVQVTGTASPVDGFTAATFSIPALGDIDGDGDLDAVVGGNDGLVRCLRNGIVPPAINLQQQTGAANPLGTVNLGTNNDLAPNFGDLDGDGDLDALLGSADGTVRYYKNTGSPTSPVYVLQINAANPFNGFGVQFDAAPVLGDLDADGDLDAVVGCFNGDLRYLKNTGSALSPVFVEQTGPANPFDGFSVGDFDSTPALADLDGDGDLDALVGRFDGLFQYLKNTGSAGIPTYVAQAAASNPFNAIDIPFSADPTLGDLDGDGDFDAVVATGLGTLQYFKNTGSATSPVYAEQVGAANPYNGIDVGGGAGVGLGDLDSDGDLDTMVGEFHGVLFYFQTNRAPVVENAIPDQTFTGPGAKSYTVPADTFAELENNSLTYTATLTSGAALPAWLSFNAATRQFSGNPVRLETSPLQIRVIANDGKGGGGFDDFQLTLVNVGDPPVAGNDTYSVNQDTVLTANGVGPNPAGVLSNDNDPEGFALSAGVITQPAHGTVGMSLNGSFTYTPTAGYSGPDSFTYQSGNGVLVSNIATVSITVNDTAGPSVQTSQFQFNTAPQKLTVKFSENVAASLSTADFQVTGVPSGTAVPFTLSYDAPSSTATLTFSSILADGNYHLKVLAAGITDASGNAMSANHDLDIFFLAGDADHDKDVDVNDLGILASNWQASPRTFAQGDFDYSGTVDVNDLGILASHWQQTLSGAGPAGSPAPGMRGSIKRATSLAESIFASPKLRNRSGLISALDELR